MDPVLASRNLRSEYSPINSPAQHKQQFLKNIMFWLMLQPLILAGKVLVFPDPGDLNPEFQYAMRAMAAERTAKWRLDPQQLEEFSWMLRDDLERSLLQLPDRALLPLIRAAAPNREEDHYLGVLAQMRRKGEDDPLALLQSWKTRSALTDFHGSLRELEVALFMAQISNAVIVTDVGALWEHLHLHTRAAQSTPPASTDSAIELNAPINPLRRWR